MKLWLCSLSNAIVTDWYQKTIAGAFEELGFALEWCSEWRQARFSSEDWAIAIIAPDVHILRKRGCKHVAFWAQGAWPEESYMRNHSHYRRIVAGIIEKRALSTANIQFFVSQEMRRHYETKYHIQFPNSYIMPCMNEELHPEAFQDDRYQGNVFCYAGSMAVWQCFDETIALYKKIEERFHSIPKLLLLTQDQDEARLAIKKYGINNYEIDYVSVDQLPRRLREVKYGFILREASVVNAVATPTKAGTYIANGIIPIYSSTLTGLDEMLSRSRYTIAYGNDGNLLSIEKSMSSKIRAGEIYEDFSVLFEQYYSRANHIKRLSNFLEGRVSK